MTPSFVYSGTVAKVVDGDTVDVHIDLGFKVYIVERLRLRGIDTNETNDADPVKRYKALLAKDRLVNLLLNKKVTLQTFKADKYGRYLADLYIDDVNVNQLLLTEGLAVAYDGGVRV